VSTRATHVFDDFDGCVPDAEFFAQFVVEGFEEWLVEILDGFLLLETGEEFCAIHAV
jgi:hypothetical protein